MEIDKRERNLYKNLKQQISKIKTHNRQGSFKTRERYYDANLRFAKHLATKYGVQNYGNIKDKHLESYINEMKEKGLSPSTIKTDLSGIRFFHNQNSRSKNTLSGNEKFNLNKRSFGGQNKAWKENEYHDFKSLCYERNMERIAEAATLAWGEGLRIHEVIRMDRNQVEKALKTNSLIIKGKGGKIREVPLSSESKEMLGKKIQEINRGEKVFIKKEEKTHLVIKQIQNFINRNRQHFQDGSKETRKVDVTFHGLRHSYAQSTYTRLVSDGSSPYQARLEVSNLLGHERDDVTRIYL